MKKFTYLVILSVLLPKLVFSQAVKIETLSSGLLLPVGIHNTGLPNDTRLFVLEKRGRIKIVDRLTGAITPTPFLDIYSRVYPATTAGDERGLLGLAFHPDYVNNGYFYVDYVNTNGKTVIARYQVSPFADTAFKYSEQIIMTIFQPYTNHNGGNLMFGPEDGYLYISMGDGGNGGDPGNRAQNIDSLLGKTLRIDVNNPAAPYYFSAPGNPFYGSTPGRDEIFDWGLRNHWRCSFDRMKHDMWVADVGQSVVEEINFRPKCDTIGHNYGWRCYEGNSSYNTAGCQSQSSYISPIYDYAHSLGCSVTGGYVYRGGQEGALFGKYLFTDYCQGRIWATEPNGTGGWTTSQLPQTTPQINNNYSSWGEDVYGELYLSGVASGKIYKISDTACAPTAYINAPDTLYTCAGNQVTLEAINGTGLTYGWVVIGSGNWTYTTTQNGRVITALHNNSPATLYVTVSNGTCSAVSNTVVVIPQASFSGLDSVYCNFSLPSNLIGLPSGGTFGGNGISGNTFNPANASAGTHTITYSFSDSPNSCNYNSSGCTFNVSKTVMVSPCSGISGPNTLSQVKIFPNPSSGIFTFSKLEKGVSLEIYDVIGNLIYHRVSTDTVLELDLNEKTKGVYFYKLSSNKTDSRFGKLVLN
ncbi:PQQ-dependent sugar dehydrogenase [Aurantibacillus circumpalustris]|uniref:PQQ-dependent sugar dehydrogenase n=1 Tax=Aurantibacillus circumpalustris TaxID=3036359 RepID=UPI00295AC6BC|nr:PQQ-dependent sugar dehydrogenase [Aurantibacillus circumpalustris]